MVVDDDAFLVNLHDFEVRFEGCGIYWLKQMFMGLVRRGMINGMILHDCEFVSAKFNIYR